MVPSTGERILFSCHLSVEVYTGRRQQSSLLSDFRKAGFVLKPTTFLLCRQQHVHPSVFHLVLPLCSPQGPVLRESLIPSYLSARPCYASTYALLLIGDLDTEARRSVGCLLHSLTEAKSTEPNTSPNGRKRERWKKEATDRGLISKPSNANTAERAGLWQLTSLRLASLPMLRTRAAEKAENPPCRATGFLRAVLIRKPLKLQAQLY